MLESGSVVFDCQIGELLSDNGVYQSYVVNCSDTTSLKLIYVPSNPHFSKEPQHSFLN